MNEPTAGQRILDVLMRVPKDIEWQDLLSSSAIGGGLGLVGALLLSNRENRNRNMLIGSVLGTALGGYSSMVARNIREEMGGHFNTTPDYYNPKTLLDMAKRSGNKRITLYVAGADNVPGGAPLWSDFETGKNGVFMYKWGDTIPLAKAMKTLKESGYQVDVVSHSAGATAVFGALDRLDPRYAVDSVNILDPVDLNHRRFLYGATSKYSDLLKNKTNKAKLHLAKDRSVSNLVTAGNDANKWINNNPFVLTNIPKVDTIWHNDNHSMFSTKLRSPGLHTEWYGFAQQLPGVIDKYNN